MEKYSCIQVLVVLCLLLSEAYWGVLSKNEYERDELIPFKKMAMDPLSGRTECCAGCLYIDGIGCIDPNDGSIRPKIMTNMEQSNVQRKLECCAGCIFIIGVGCIDPNDGSIHPYITYINKSAP